MSVIYRSAIPIDVSVSDMVLSRPCQAIFVGDSASGAIALDMASKSAEIIVTQVNATTGEITEVQLLYPGEGYQSAPLVEITDVLGTGAEFSTTIANGKVTDISIDDGGTGYSINRPPQVKVFQDPKQSGLLFSNVPAGILPISVSKVYNSGTTATNLLALYI